jgi:hypothetical protein
MINLKQILLSGICVALVAGGCVMSAGAQTPDAKEKPRMYTYEAFWTVPRAKWNDWEKDDPATQKALDKALAGGTLVGYGADTVILHSEDGTTHDSWWSALSLAGTLDVLDSLEKSSTAPTSILTTASKHHDSLWVSHHYNWHAGSWKGAYTYASTYTLKADAPDDAVDVLADNVIVPIFEKLLADGTIVEYEIDTQAVHSDDPNLFALAYISPTAAGLDKVNAAIRAAIKSAPLGGTAFGAFVDWSKHRDYLTRTSATYR